ncbi:unnamed protein product [Adineta ricciae]|uniref:Uncharacterized protein n=1 Tax=Adineta ricciae TaxID=249248 RepID=A0A814FY36_ADIRI|nr:unnamed protein product [Adineta ricciae]
MATSIEQVENDDESSYDFDVHPITLSTFAVSSQQSLAASLANSEISNGKLRHGVRSFLQKLFHPTKISFANQEITSTNHEALNMNYINETAYPIVSPLPVTQGPIRLFILRHAERLDCYYSSQWVRQAFDKDDKFCRFSPILPETIPSRTSICDFVADPPLTLQGLKDAYRTGIILREKNIDIHYCYSSPSLRCIQTATKLLEGLHSNHKLKIRIEPGLFEYTTWYANDETTDSLEMPRFLTKKELLENQYSIDKNYHEQMSISEISRSETESDYYERSHRVTTAILKQHENDLITQVQQGQTSTHDHLHVLFIAHAPTLETCTRKLCGGKFRSDRLSSISRHIDFLSMTVIEKKDNNCDRWMFRRSSIFKENT